MPNESYEDIMREMERAELDFAILIEEELDLSILEIDGDLIEML